MEALGSLNRFALPAVGAAALGAVAAFALLKKSSSSTEKGAKWKFVRQLVGAEEMYVLVWSTGLRQIQVGYTITVRGALEIEVLKNALMRIQLQQPAWRCGVSKRGGRFWYHEFDDAPDRIRLNRVTLSDKLTFNQHIEQKLDTPVTLSPENLLWWVDLIQQEEGNQTLNHIVVWQQHCITDGASVMELTADMLRELQNAVDLAPMPAKVAPEIPCSIGERIQMTPGWKQIPFWLRAVPRALAGYVYLKGDLGAEKTPIAAPLVHTKRTHKFVNTSIPMESISKLRQLCKSRGITVSAAIIAAVCRSIQRHTGFPEGHKYAAHIPINPRSRMGEYNISKKQYMAGLSSIEAEIVLSPSEPFWDLAQRVYRDYLRPETFGHSIADGEMFFEGANRLISMGGSVVNQMQTDPEQRGKISLSCIGAYQGDEYPEATRNFKLQNLQMAIPLGAAGPYPLMMAWTYGNTFYFCFTYQRPLMLDKTAQNFVDSVIRELQELQQ